MSEGTTSSQASRSRPEEAVRVLIIEDNPPDVLLVGEALQHQGIRFELTHWRDGDEAVSKLLGHRDSVSFNLIILDLNMPRIGGLQVLEQLRSDPFFHAVPIMVLTSSLSAEERQQALLQGATRFVRKPTDLYEFLDQVGTGALELLNSSSA